MTLIFIFWAIVFWFIFWTLEPEEDRTPPTVRCPGEITPSEQIAIDGANAEKHAREFCERVYGLKASSNCKSRSV